MKKKGFTLIELLAVVVLLAIIALVLVPVVGSIIEGAREQALKNSLNGVLSASKLYYHTYMSQNEEETFRMLSFEDNVQTDSYEKLDYKGSIKHGFVGIVDDSQIAVCIDNGKIYASKSLDSEDIVLDEGSCTDEFDQDVYAFVTVGTANYIGLRLNVKQYSSSSSLPSSASQGTVSVITDNKVTGYYVAKYAPVNPSEGTVWLVLKDDSEHIISTKTSAIGIAYVAQYHDGEWYLKESYAYNDKWDQLTDYSGSIYEWNYDYTGHYEEFTAPFSGYYVVELWGAAGGDATTSIIGGKGAYTKGEIYLNTGEKLYVYVGQKGRGNTGGWNGGGNAPTNYSGVNSFGGGGATDIRLTPTSSATVWNEGGSLRTRIMVAAAGGGSSNLVGYNSSLGGSGGGLTGYNGTQGSSYVGPGSGATQISGGTQSGSFGVGGTAASLHTNGGGGSGWYGGGGATNYYSGGAGGSSFISGHKGCVAVDDALHVIGTNVSYTGKYFINTTMIDGEGYTWSNKREIYVGMPNYSDGSTMKGNDGNGYARIKFKKFASISTEEYTRIGEDLQDTWLYDYMGYYQVFIAPKAGRYKVELWGAAGGDAASNIPGGAGAYTRGDLVLSKGETLYVYVGGQGRGNAGGWNGGGGAPTNYSGVNSYGGGGATDIRTVATSLLTSTNEAASLKTRIMVAGAGGGSSFLSGYSSSLGGAAGGLTAYDGSQGSSYVGHGGGATQTVGGSGQTGGFGYGGTAASYHTNGGGGAGWYGGGGATNYYNGGGGGSSYISGHDGCIGITVDMVMKNNDSTSYTGHTFTNTLMVDGQGYKWTNEKKNLVKMPTHDGETLMTGNTGNGYAKITYLGN